PERPGSITAWAIISATVCLATTGPTAPIYRSTPRQEWWPFSWCNAPAALSGLPAICFSRRPRRSFQNEPAAWRPARRHHLRATGRQETPLLASSGKVKLHQGCESISKERPTSERPGGNSLKKRLEGADPAAKRTKCH